MKKKRIFLISFQNSWLLFYYFNSYFIIFLRRPILDLKFSLLNLCMLMYSSYASQSNIQLTPTCKPSSVSSKMLELLLLMHVKQLHSEIYICIIHWHYMEFNFPPWHSNPNPNFTLFPSFTNYACGNNP